MTTQSDYYVVYNLLFVTGDYKLVRVLFEDPDPDSVDPENPDMIPRDWTGWTARAQIRATNKRDAEVTATIDVTLGETDPSDGFVILEIQEDQSALCLKNGGWDLEVTNPEGKPETVMGGKTLPYLDYTHD